MIQRYPAAQVQGRINSAQTSIAMGCSGSMESMECTTALPPCKGKELTQVVNNGSKKVSFGCKKVSFDSIETLEVEVEADERKPSKEVPASLASPEASLQRFLEMIDANGKILEEKVSRKRRRDFGLLEGIESIESVAC
eukprot:s481_g20.t1